MPGVTERIEAALAALAEREPAVHALLEDETPKERRTRLLREARELEKRWPREEERPPLFGALVGVKDIFHAAGFPVRAGSRLPADLFHEPGVPGFPAAGARSDARSVALLRSAGALILGKTVTTEFAYFGPGPTANPLNVEHTPGGSSSGSAAAVAARYCDLALGTQTIGSISRPATFCGVAGYKPTAGRISADGVVPFSASADHVGVIAGDTAMLQRAASVLVEGWRATGSTAGAPRTVLVPRDRYTDQADAEARDATDALVERLRGLGISVQEVEILNDIQDINERHQDLIAGEFAAVHREWFAAHENLYHPRSAELIHRGSTISTERQEEARRGQRELRNRLDEALKRHDAAAWIAPATTGEAPRGLVATGNPIMNLPWTYAGVPTVSLPLHHLPHGTGPAGLPLGVQIAAGSHSDETLLALAGWVERAIA